MTAQAGGREKWLLAGQSLLREAGIRAVKLEALAMETGLTTGSFYHHFASMGTYLDELARYFGAEQVAAGIMEADDVDPQTRLLNIATRARDANMVALYAAMRGWAQESGEAELAVRGADHVMLTFLKSTFRELGHPEEAARLRALTVMSVAVAQIHEPWRRSSDFEAELLSFVSSR